MQLSWTVQFSGLNWSPTMMLKQLIIPNYSLLVKPPIFHQSQAFLYPLVIEHSYWTWPIYSWPLKNGDFRYANVYQRVFTNIHQHISPSRICQASRAPTASPRPKTWPSPPPRRPGRPRSSRRGAASRAAPADAPAAAPGRGDPRRWGRRRRQRGTWGRFSGGENTGEMVVEVCSGYCRLDNSGWLLV